ncbi:Quinone oxidoreductase PIG3 [Lachnellula suecica]|uniref:Quinone oxidoreductase PIG3 n=1 Tax=Lachnellula suecica TaxID=602035 RepID=A0A8T9C9Z3_9HELO|nr:Quinone oxidoreductase PIG3 [Lachnellula suecica]
MTETMKAVDIRGGTGDASSLFINPETPKPIPTPQECLVRVRAFGLNRGDTMQRQGFYPPPPGVPKTLGLEFSGLIASVGGGENAGEMWKVGDEVFGLVYGGAYAEFVAVDKRMLMKKPPGLSWESCGGMCESWFTAVQALYLVGEFNPKLTRSVLWHAGASTVSICGIQLSVAAAQEDSSSASPKVFATTRQETKRDFCVSELGCTGAVNTLAYPDKGGWESEIVQLNGGQGIDLIIDFIGGPYFSSNLALAARDGKIINLGLMGGALTAEGEAVNISPIIMKRLRYEGSTLRSRDVEYQVRVKALFEEKVLPKILDGSFKNVISKVFEWENVVEAHKLMESNNTKGKIVCTISS